MNEEIQSSIKRKLHGLLMEYGLDPNNQHVGSGLGGNIQYLGYVYGLKSILTKDVERVEIKDGAILWNPDFLSVTPLSEIRNRLDEVIKLNIEKENFKFPISVVHDEKSNKSQYSFDEFLIDEKIKNIDPESLLKGEVELPDLTSLNTIHRMCLCMRICAKFAVFLDNDPDAKKYYKGFYNTISKFDDVLTLVSIRSQIGLERIVNFNLDEDEALWPYLLRISKTF